MCYRRERDELPETPDKDPGFSGANEIRMDTSEKRAPANAVLMIGNPDMAEYMTFLKRRRAAASDERARASYEPPRS